jgi:hypothetical protein
MFVYAIKTWADGDLDYGHDVLNYILIHSQKFSQKTFDDLVYKCKWIGVSVKKTPKGNIKKQHPNSLAKTVENLRTLYGFQAYNDIDVITYDYDDLQEKPPETLIINSLKDLNETIETSYDSEIIATVKESQSAIDNGDIIWDEPDKDGKTILTLEIPEDEYFLILEACLKTRTSIDDFIAEAIRALLAKEAAKIIES